MSATILLAFMLQVAPQATVDSRGAFVRGGLLAVGVTADAATTLYGLRHNDLSEGNGLIAPLTRSTLGFTLFQSGILVGTIAGVEHLHHEGHHRLAWVVVIGVTAIRLASAVHNLQVIHAR